MKRNVAIGLFLASAVSRLMFWQATPDRHWPWSAYYKGDAPLWIDAARAMQLGQPFELGLPIHPPGTAWLVNLLWNGEPAGIVMLRLMWVLLGALIPPLLFLAAERSFGMRIAAVAGGFCAIATGLLMLSTSINSETPYLLLVLCGALAFRPADPPRRRLAAWAALNAIACLFRVDHLLFVLLVLSFFAMVWFRRGDRIVPRVLLALLFFAVPLIPWHLSAWSAIRRFNGVPRQLSPIEEQAISNVEQSLPMPWTAGAQQRRDELPAFVRRTASAFVLATVYYRGGREVRTEDFAILEEAFGYFPRPLQRYPFVSLYGPLNFALANNAHATGGFDRSLLEEPPPLAGGAHAYPPFLVQGLPPGQLTFFYPPHLRLFNDGYSIGWQWIARHPREFARLAARKVALFWSGAAHGWTGYGFPSGMSGTRRAVDFLISDASVITTAWRIALLLLAVAGILVAWRAPDLWPWLLFFASKLAVCILFFGYARLGALTIPVVALLVALAAQRLLARIPAKALIAMLLLAVAADIVRVATKPSISLDTDPPDVHTDQRVTTERRRRAG